MAEQTKQQDHLRHLAADRKYDMGNDMQAWISGHLSLKHCDEEQKE